MRTALRDARRIILKVGSALVTRGGNSPALDTLRDWARQIAQLRQDGREVILVSSGAIATGMGRIGWSARPREIHLLQAAAAVGQMDLIRAYETVFGEHGLMTAQILLTHDDLAGRKRYLNARSTLNALLELGIVPIVNENDTIVTDEIRLGDNDTLGALVANLADADLLIILTDQQGLYTADPRKDPAATLIPEGSAEDPAFERMSGSAGTAIGTGGMITKVRAARRAAKSGTHTLIASGHEPDALLRLMAGETLGTLLTASRTPLAARKRWLADHLQTVGNLTLDEGAVHALRNGKSLLPIGVLAVEGRFERGAAIDCRDSAGQTIARGLINYTAGECRRIIRHPSADIASILGYMEAPELIHRDNMVLIA
ncbi:MAG: glutamate 5-kinase [Rhodocyclaceae bacterium]|nr:glutamate 5-kinase [Rhodocyclaceae bacterium]